MVFFLIVLLLLVPVSSSSVFKYNKSSFIINGIENKNERKLSFFEYGRQTGIRYKIIYHILKSLFMILNPEDVKNKIIHNSFKTINELKKYCPSFLEELRGLSISTNIAISQLISIGDFLSKYIGESCTNTLITRNATLGDKTYLTQNVDTKSKSPNLFLIRFIFAAKYHINVSDGNNYVFLGIPILSEYPLLNEKGLGFGATGTSLTDDPDRYIDHNISGMTTYCLERLTMQKCSNVSQVAKLWNETERSSNIEKDYPYHWDFSSPVFCDSEGGILLMEQTHSNISFIFGNSDIVGAKEDIIWHTNHHIYLDPYKSGSKTASEYNSSRFRTERAKTLLEDEYYGNVTLDVCKKIMSDHKGGSDKNKKDSYDICRHPDENDSHVTAISWIIEISPGKFKFHWTRGSPCSSNHFMGRYKTRNFPHLLSKFLDFLNNLF